MKNSFIKTAKLVLLFAFTLAMTFVFTILISIAVALATRGNICNIFTSFGMQLLDFIIFFVLLATHIIEQAEQSQLKK